MTQSKNAKVKDKVQKKEVRTAKRKAKAELQAKAKIEANKTKEVMTPLRSRVQALVQEYEDRASFEHARRMNKLLHGLVRIVETGFQEAEKDLARIAGGERPCQPSELRQRLDDLLWDAQ